MSLGSVLIPGRRGNPVSYAPFAAGPPAAALQQALTVGGVVLPLGISLVYFRLTNAMILAGADVSLGLAPGTTRTYLPVGAMLTHTNTLAAVYNTTRTISLAYANNPTIGLTAIQNIVQAATAENAQRLTAIAGGPLAPGTTFTNQPLVAHFSGGNTGGNAANFVDLICSVLCFEGANL